MPPKGKKQQAQPAQRTSTIRTRNMGLSPGGAHSLPNTRKDTVEHRRTRQQLRPANQVDADDATSSAQPTSSEDAVASTLQPQTPPTTTSRSQSPHLETESDSLAHVPESRSTSPPIRTTRSQSRSMSPFAAEQKAKLMAKAMANGKRSGTSKKTAGKPSRSKRTRDEFDAHNDGDAEVNVAEAATVAEEPPAKRSRIENELPAVADELNPEPEKAAAVVADESSADDGPAEVERPPRLARSRSASRQLPPVSETNTDDASAEESSSDNYPPEANRASPIKPIQQRSTSLTPKPIPSTSASKQYKPMTDDPVERARRYKEITGGDMHLVPFFDGATPYSKSKGRSSINLEVDPYNFDYDADNWETMTGFNHPKHTIQSLIRSKTALSQRVNRAKLPQILPTLSSDNLEAGKAKRNGTTASSSGPKPTRRMVAHYQRNATLRPPTAAEMTELLTRFDAEEAAKATSAEASSPSPAQPTEARHESITSENLRLDQQVLQAESDIQDEAVTVGQYSEGNAVAEAVGEVQPEDTPEPQTPTPQQPQAQESRGWFKGVSALLTPLKNNIFGRRGQAAQATPTTNGDSVVGVSSIEHLIPTTSDFAVPPTTPTNPLNRRKVIPRTEPKPILHHQPRTGPKTQNHVHFTSPGTIPIHMRGLLSEKRKREIWREQDEKKVRNRGDRQARVEEEDEEDATLLIDSVRPGEKRKSRHPNLPENFNHEGHYSAPSPSSSDEGDSQIDVDMAEGDANRKGGLSQQTGSSPQVGSYLLQELEPYDERLWFKVYAKRFKQKFGREPVEPQFGDSDWHVLHHCDHIDRSLMPSEYFLPEAEPWSLYPHKGHDYVGRGSQEDYEGKIESGDPAKIAEVFESIERNYSYHWGTHQNKPHYDPRHVSGRTFRRFPNDNWHPTPTSSLVTNPKGLGTSIRNNTYNGTTFAQPPNVQANIDEGKYPLAPRDSSPSRRSAPGRFTPSKSANMFTASTPDVQASQQVMEELPLQKMAGFLLRAEIEKLSLRELQKAFSKVPVTERYDVYDKLTDKLKKKVDAINLWMERRPSQATSQASVAVDSGSSGFGINHDASTPPAPAASASPGDLFSRITAPAGDLRIGIYAHAAASDSVAEGTYIPTTTRTFSADFEEKSDEDEAQITLEDAAGDASVLQPKTWTQTPPPKPKPSNAQLPQVPAQPTAAELAKARIEKFKPTKPSGLRNVTQMSPLHSEQETGAVGQQDDPHFYVDKNGVRKFLGYTQEEIDRYNLDPKHLIRPRKVKQMSPLHPEQEAASTGMEEVTNREAMEEWKATWTRDVQETRALFDPEVMAAVDAISEDQMMELLPASVYDITTVYPFDPEVVGEVMRLLPLAA